MPITEQVFTTLFRDHYRELYRYGFSMTRNEQLAEEIASGAFLKLWQKKGGLSGTASLVGYLFRSVHHACLDHIKHEKIKKKYELHVKSKAMYEQSHNETTSPAELSQLQKRLQLALADLPEQCRTIFHLSRTEDLTYQQIADRLGLSVKTVETQMGRALKRLRRSLTDFFPY